MFNSMLLLAIRSLDGSPNPFSTAAGFGIIATVGIMLLLTVFFLRAKE